MRFSVIALYGAASVSALAVPGSSPATHASGSSSRRAAPKPIDLAQFGKFKTTTLEEAKSKLAATLQKVGADVDSLLSTATAATKIDWDNIRDHDNASYVGGAVHPDQAASHIAARQSGGCTNPAVRVEWRDLNDQDRNGWIQAVKKLMELPASGAYSASGAKSRYDDLVAVHYQMTESIHGVAQFLLWHRYYLHLFEDLLRSEAGFTGPLPWWDETRDAGNFAKAPMYTSAYLGAAPLASNGQGFCITDGAFANKQLTVGGTQCLARGVDEGATSNCNQDFLNTCNSHPSFSDMAGCAELGPHAYGHNGIGAVMAGVPTSPNDPSFFLHHGFVDHAYRIWQIADPNNRLTQINGCADKANPCTAATSGTVLGSQGLRPDKTVGDVFDTTGGYLCYRYSY
ncbi:Di-copper centre-containing protein [Apiospora arundinis]|uniref:Di-copper centre-containing protein n=1 Tax=Apiospora arundinis TaxID=335852 RepID=A0ABR2JH69_9PEZI